ncbi:DUF4160 domain-containing protein [Pseudomonas synxantha]
MYPDDHAPPHFHVQTPDGESLVQIEGLLCSVQAPRRKP